MVWLLSGVLFIVALLPYLQTGRFELINFDDPVYIEPPSRVPDGITLSSLRWAFTTFLFNWHPLTWISLMLDYSLFGGKPGAMHLHNAFLHAVNAALLFVFLLRMTREVWSALAAAALFALHPLRVEAVVWIAARKDLLNALFWVLTMLAYVDYARRKDAGQPNKLAYVGAHLALILGIMAKGMIVSLPLILLLLDFWPLRRFDLEGLFRGDRRALRRFAQLIAEKIPMFLIVAAGVVVTIVGQSKAEALVDTGGISIPWRFANALFSYITYLRQTLWSSNLSIFYPHPAVLGHQLSGLKIILAVALILLITGGAVASRKERPYVLVGWLWFLITLFPVLGLIQIGSQAHADRYMYIPSIGIFIAAVWLIVDVMRRWQWPIWLPVSGCALCVAAFGIASYRQAAHWRNSETVFTHAIEATPDSYVAHNQLGLVLIEKDQLKTAAQEFAVAVDTYPRYASGHNNLAIALQRMNDIPGALEHFDLALQIDPTYVDAMINLGSLLSAAGQHLQAVPYFAKVAQLRPADASARFDYGIALATVGQIDPAIEEFEAALRLQPFYPGASNALAQAISIRDNYRRKQSAGMMSTTAATSTTDPATNVAATIPTTTTAPAATSAGR